MLYEKRIIYPFWFSAPNDGEAIWQEPKTTYPKNKINLGKLEWQAAAFVTKPYKKKNMISSVNRNFIALIPFSCCGRHSCNFSKCSYSTRSRSTTE